jgi:prepilin-type N-terminal cleavage/methylation domain-containing protein
VRRLRLRLRDERGVTLVELITTMGILAVVLGGISTLFVAGTRSQADLDRRFQALTQLRLGLDKLRKDVHSACYAVDTSGVKLTDGATPTTVTLYMPSTCDSSNAITWCTQGSGTRWGLYRAVGTSCAGGVLWSDYLTTGSVFTFHDYNTPAGSYASARLSVHLPDNVQGSGAGTYTLDDDLVFRNSPRCTIGTDCP